MRAPDEDQSYYFWGTVIMIGYWYIVLSVLDKVFMKHNSIYRGEDRKGKALYLSYVQSSIHALVSCLLATIGMFFVCGDGKNVFNSDSCINTPKYIHIWALLHSTSYFIYDFLVQWFIVEGSAPIDYQTYAHHLVAAGTFYQTLYFMDFMVVFGVMLLFIEVSTIFVSVRWLLYKHHMSKSPLYAINAIMMFLFFLFGRLIYQFYITFWIGAPWILKEYERKSLTFY